MSLHTLDLGNCRCCIRFRPVSSGLLFCTPHEPALPPSQANLQVESYIESLRRRSKVRLRTTSSTPSGSPPVSRWSRGGSAASGSGSSSSGGNHMADLSEAARDAAAAAAEANAAAPLQLPAQDRAAKGPSPLKSASLRTPSVVLPLPTVTVANGPTAPATGTAVLAAATPAGASAPEQPKALLPTSEAVSAVSSYLDSLRGLSARGVSSGQMGGLLTASQSQRTAARQTSALSMPVLDPDPMPRSQTTPEAAAAAAVGGYLASLRSQSQMRGAGGALPWQRVHAVAEGANPQHTPLPLPPTDAAKAAKAAAVAAAMFGGDEDDDEEEEEGDGDHDTGADGPPAAAEAPDADEGDVDLRSDSLACLSLKDDPSTAGQFSLAATAAVASVRAQLQMRSASVRLSGASRGSGSAQQRHRSQSGPLTAEQLATGSIGGGEDVAFAAASGMNPPGDDGNDDPAIKRDSGGSDDSAQAPFKVAYSPFTAMAEAASKSSSASSEGNPRSDGAQVIACAPSPAAASRLDCASVGSPLPRAGQPRSDAGHVSQLQPASCAEHACTVYAGHVAPLHHLLASAPHPLPLASSFTGSVGPSFSQTHCFCNAYKVPTCLTNTALRPGCCVGIHAGAEAVVG